MGVLLISFVMAAANNKRRLWSDRAPGILESRLLASLRSSFLPTLSLQTAEVGAIPSGPVQESGLHICWIAVPRIEATRPHHRVDESTFLSRRVPGLDRPSKRDRQWRAGLIELLVGLGVVTDFDVDPKLAAALERRQAARDGLALYEVDDLGLDKVDRAILRCLAERFGGGPVGLSTLAISVGEEPETVEDVYEPFLLQLGLLMRTPRGRVATASA